MAKAPEEPSCATCKFWHEGTDAGVTLIQHPTIAARDAYAARGGWIADREMTAITYSDQHGQVARATVRPEML